MSENANLPTYAQVEADSVPLSTPVLDQPATTTVGTPNWQSIYRYLYIVREL